MKEHEEKCSFLSLKLVFFIMLTRGSNTKMTKNLHEVTEEQPAFGCQPAFESHS